MIRNKYSKLDNVIRFNMRSFYWIWIVCFFSTTSSLFSQKVIWQRSLGGSYSEYLNDITIAQDDGFIIGGSTLSKIGGNAHYGGLDYYIHKVNKEGETVWKRTFGGSKNDQLYTIYPCRDGGYLLGGSSNSDISGSKKDASIKSYDYWIIKINASGVEEWQRTIGSQGLDKLVTIQEKVEGGYVIGGSSSTATKLKPNRDQQESTGKSIAGYGNLDYWVVSLDEMGNKQWEFTYGGSQLDELRKLLVTKDGYVLAGYSNSPVSGNKSQGSNGLGDYWIVKLNKVGVKEWDVSIGGQGDDDLFALQHTLDGGYLLGGNSNSEVSGTKTENNGYGTDFWVVKLHNGGDIEWDKTFDFGYWDILLNIVPDGENNFLLAGYAQSESKSKSDEDNRGINDYIAIIISEDGEKLWQKILSGKSSDQLKKVIRDSDGGYLLAGTSDSPEGIDKTESNKGRMDFWVIKLGDKANEEDAKIKVNAYPNPAFDYTNVYVPESFEKGTIQVYGADGRRMLQVDMSSEKTLVPLENLLPGIYHLHVIYDNKENTLSLIKAE